MDSPVLERISRELTLRKRLQDALLVFARGVSARLSLETGLEALAKTYYEQIKAHIAADPRTEYSPSQIQAGYESLLKVIRERPAALRDSVKD